MSIEVYTILTLALQLSLPFLPILLFSFSLILCLSFSLLHYCFLSNVKITINLLSSAYQRGVKDSIGDSITVAVEQNSLQPADLQRPHIKNALKNSMCSCGLENAARLKFRLYVKTVTLTEMYYIKHSAYHLQNRCSIRVVKKCLGECQKTFMLEYTFIYEFVKHKPYREASRNSILLS